MVDPNHFASTYVRTRFHFTFLTPHPTSPNIVMISLPFSGRAFPLVPGERTLPDAFLVRRDPHSGACHFRRPLPPIKRADRCKRVRGVKRRPKKKRIRRNLTLLPRPSPREPTPSSTQSSAPAPVPTSAHSAPTTPSTSTLIPGHLPARLPDTPSISAREARVQQKRRLFY